MDNKKAGQFVNRRWDESILDELVAYVRIPNKSPMFDPVWKAHGHMEPAVPLMHRWTEHEAGAVRSVPCLSSTVKVGSGGVPVTDGLADSDADSLRDWDLLSLRDSDLD